MFILACPQLFIGLFWCLFYTLHAIFLPTLGPRSPIQQSIFCFLVVFVFVGVTLVVCIGRVTGFEKSLKSLQLK